MKRRAYPIHPDFRRWANMNPPLNAATLPLLQKSMGGLFGLERSGDGVAVSRHIVTGRDGNAIPALLYTPEGLPARSPALLYCHGGGFVIPAAPYHYALAREYAKRARCQVLFPDYRLAPKYPFPAGPEDCWAAYLYLRDRAEALRIDGERIAVGGDSAGGTLALDVCFMARRRGLPMPAGLLLMYPSTGAKDTPSIRRFTDTPMCNSRDMDRYGELYTQNPGAGVHEDNCPMETASWAGFPQAYVETAEFDCLRDGGTLLAEALQREGIPAELNETKGTIHGFDIELQSSIVRACVDRRVAFLRRCFGLPEEGKIE